MKDVSRETNLNINHVITIINVKWSVKPRSRYCNSDLSTNLCKSTYNKDHKVQIALKTVWGRKKILLLSNFGHSIATRN